MREELLSYYERELTFLRQMGAEFASKYPKVASRLLLEGDRCEDPHVERLIEAFAFLAARVHLRVDDDFPEITSALMGNLYPHYVRPIPSMSVAQFELDPEQGKISTGLNVARDSTLYSRQEVDGGRCKFRTCYDTTLWPISIETVEYVSPDRLQPAVKGSDVVAAVRVVIHCLPDVSFEKLEMSSLRFYLDGESNLVHTLYELFCNNCVGILLRDPAVRSKIRPVTLPADMLSPVGFDERHGILPYTRRSFAGYRILQEYFTFPEKFFFFDLNGLECLSSGFKDQLEIVFLISRFERKERQQLLELGVSSSTLKLGCTPIVNLFARTAEPILLDQSRYEYPVVADVRHQDTTEIFSVDEVVCTDPQSRNILFFEPFYGRKHNSDGNPNPCFWHTNRRTSGIRSDARTDVYLSLVNLSGKPVRPDADTVTVRCTCTNYLSPSKLAFGQASGDFELEGAASIKRVTCLRKPTPTLRPPTGKGVTWRLLSHLSLNYLSLVDEGKEGLQQILELYNFSESPAVQNQIAGITSLRSSRHYACVLADGAAMPVRGTKVELQLDEERFVGGGVYLFATVLDQFLGSYVSMNSFCQLIASTLQRKEVLRQWPPRAGRSLLM